MLFGVILNLCLDGKVLDSMIVCFYRVVVCFIILVEIVIMRFVLFGWVKVINFWVLRMVREDWIGNGLVMIIGYCWSVVFRVLCNFVWILMVLFKWIFFILLWSGFVMLIYKYKINIKYILLLFIFIVIWCICCEIYLLVVFFWVYFFLYILKCYGIMFCFLCFGYYLLCD